MRTLALIALLAAGPGDVNVSFEDKLLVSVPEDVSASKFIVSRDGKTCVYVGGKGGQFFVGVNKDKGPTYQSIADLTITPDGKPCYRAVTPAGSVIVMKGTPGQVMPVMGRPVVSPDGNKVAFSCSRGVGGPRDGTAWCVYAAGAKGPDFGACSEPSWSADSTTHAYTVRIAKAGTATRAMHTMAAMAVNHKPGPEYDGVMGPWMAPKGNGIAYKAQTKLTYQMVVDGKAHATYPEIGDPVWSPDGKSILYAARTEGRKAVLVVDGKPSEEVDLIRGTPVWSADGKHHAYAAVKGKEAFIVVDGKALEPWPYAENPAFSPDGTVVAYAAKAAGAPKWGQVFGEKKGTPDYELVGTAVISPDGKRVAYPAQWKYKWIMVVDDGKNEMMDDIRPPTWSPDSTKIAYAALKEGKWFMVVNYRRQEPFDEILTPAYWSPDGKKVAFGGRKGPDVYWRVVTVPE
jgi:Tol biopolymer transport system component